MELTDELFKVGDWVTVDSGLIKGFTGYITKYDFEDDRYFVNLTSTGNGNAINTGRWIDVELLVPAKKFKEEGDLLALIDMALDTDDEKWFLELTSQLPLANFQVRRLLGAT
jgi:hypothetical protein